MLFFFLGIVLKIFNFKNILNKVKLFYIEVIDNELKLRDIYIFIKSRYLNVICRCLGLCLNFIFFLMNGL